MQHEMSNIIRRVSREILEKLKGNQLQIRKVGDEMMRFKKQLKRKERI